MAVSAQSQRRSLRLKRPANWPWFVLAILFIGYWALMSSMERVDANAILAGYFMPGLTPLQVESVNFNPLVTGAVKMFHWRVLRHFIPLIIGWWLAVQAAISLMQVLYNCPDRKAAADFLGRQRSDRGGHPGEPFTALPEKLVEGKEKSILLGVGGPVRVHIPDGFAAVTERNSRFLRVLPPGAYNLERFEHLFTVVDLHPQEKTARDVAMLTKEGIPVQVDVSLTFSIDPGGESATHRRPFPFNEEAVKKAAYGGAVGADGKVSSWSDAPLGKVKKMVASSVREDSLDDLIAAPNPRDAHHMLTQEVTRKVWDQLPKDGIKPLSLRIGRLSPPPEVSRQYIEFWMASQRKKDLLARANGTVQLLQEVETARISAEIEMIQAIVDGVRQAQQEAGAKLSGYLVALRLLEALRRMFAASTQNLQNVGGDSGQLISDIHLLDEKLADLGSNLQAPPRKFIPSGSG